ncbi:MULTISPECIES: hypothetical protein [unclassified Sphingopyxis]|uniref:hypothetical protein n=1 Tax=unclassified Sphingopyxis TaxID=2614943 RepID=UPI0024AD3131|nr:MULTISPECIES: hypothetical protein [unclassified Sphingopyxis]
MNQLTGGLVGRPSQRKLLVTQSSAAALGLKLEDIMRGGLASEQVKRIHPATAPTLAERVFQALVDAKIWTSKVAMHLDRGTRDRYFRQLDLLHDCDEWFGDQSPVVLDSYKAFVRFMHLIGGLSKPSLGLSPKGILVAVWHGDHGRLTIEFLSSDWVQWTVSRPLGDRTERAAGNTELTRILPNLAPYSPEAWFNVG